MLLGERRQLTGLGRRTGEGLSTTTGRPAFRAAVASGTCVLFGDAITIRSSSPARSKSSSGVAAIRTSGNSARACCCRSGFEVTTVSRARPSVAVISGAWNTEPARP